MINKYFLYRHIRLDNYKPFYIGICTKQVNSPYQRAFAKHNRNKWWQNIVSKTQYKVEIILESDDVEYIKSKEIEFIKLYKSTVCNITEGGDSISAACKNEVYKYSLEGKFICKYESGYEACRENNISTSSLNRCLTGKRVNNNLAGYQWFYEDRGLEVAPIKTGRNSTKRKVRLFNSKEEYIFDSREECSKFIKRSPSRVTDLIKQGYFNNYIIENYEN